METKTQGKLTEGPILRVLLKLALPIMASSFLSTAYSITDMAWIGMLGSKAVAGVGVGGMYSWLSQGLAMMARMGGQVHVGQALGCGDRERAKRFAGTAMQLILLLGLAFGSICLFFTDFLVSFFGLTDAVTIQYAVEYMKIACGLIIFSYVGNVLTGLFTAQGDSQTPLKANAIGLITNMILDPLLILGVGPFPKLEVVGAAVATVLAQVIVVGVMIFGIFQSKEEENVLKEISLFKLESKEYMAEVVRIGGPSAIQNMMYCMISMVLTRMAAAFGEGAIAAQRVGGQIESLSWNVSDGFAAAMNAFIAQNYGAKKPERMKKGYHLAAFTIAVWGTFILAAFAIFPEQISSIFFHEPESLAFSVKYLMILGISQPFMCVEITAVGAIAGLGETKVSSIISIILTATRIPLAMFLTNAGLGVGGIWWAITLSSVVKGFVLHFTLKHLLKKVS